MYLKCNATPATMITGTIVLNGCIDTTMTIRCDENDVISLEELEIIDTNEHSEPCSGAPHQHVVSIDSVVGRDLLLKVGI